MSAKVKTLVFTMQDDLGIVVHSDREPTPEDWELLIEGMRRVDLNRIRTLSITEGGAPNSAQREQLNQMLAGKKAPAAVITDNMKVRGVVTALSWFNPLIKAFAPSRLAEALDHLRVDRSRLASIEAEIRRLRLELAGSSSTVPRTGSGAGSALGV